MIGYHGTQTPITHLNPHADLCVTTDPTTAQSYAHYDTPTGGYLHTIHIDAHLADEDDLREAAATVYGRPIADDEHLFLLADNPDVRARLAQEGYDGVEYTDQDLDGDDHDCIRIWHTHTLTITDTTEIQD